jgi:hypothetical protein
MAAPRHTLACLESKLKLPEWLNPEKITMGMAQQFVDSIIRKTWLTVEAPVVICDIVYDIESMILANISYDTDEHLTA